MTLPRNPIRYRLGIDLGTGSLGWAVLELDSDDVPTRVVRLGSRIFGTGRKPKDNSSLAADRRQARQMRRRRDRYIGRRNRLLHELTVAGLFPVAPKDRAALKSLHPFRLRHDALTQELTPHAFGRALFHLQQRRGFQSNRKTDKGDAENSAMKAAIRDFDADLGDDTVGAYLWKQIQKGHGARAKHRMRGTKVEYDFYVDRAMIKREFDAMWESQSRFHPQLLTADARDRIYRAIFDQRKLKPVSPGKCRFEDGETRAPDALPSSQLFRIYETVNALQVLDNNDLTLKKRPLTREQRDRAVEFLRTRPKATFSALKKELFGRAAYVEFTHEAGERSNILGDIVSHLLSGPDAIGDRWHSMSLDEQDALAMTIESAESDKDLALRLQVDHGLAEDEATYIADKINLPDGHRRLSTVAIRKILPHLMDGWDDAADKPLTYDRAVEAAGYGSHSQFHKGDLHDRLPYYGEILHKYTQDVTGSETATNPDEWEFGRIANPTVHIGLNQIRTVVNALVDEYGLPAQIHVEVARELGQSAKARAEASKRRNQNEKENTAIRTSLQEDFGGQRPTYANRVRLRLYNELGPLNHRCVITGLPIDRSRLFTNDYQVDHILPFSRTLDDSYANKILIHHTANQFKGNRTPYEAYHASEEDWEAILDRAEQAFRESSPGKLRRFGADAMDRYDNGDQDFIARQLNDTAYLARVSKQYFGSIIDPDHVTVTPGRLTSMLRHSWGLNGLLSDSGTKERTDHRHHAVDAAVIALSDRRTLKRVTDANRRAEDRFGSSNEDGVKKLLDDMPLPWDGFVDEMQSAVDRIVVSHRPDHGVGGQLHEETAYGVLEGPDKEGRYLTRKRQTDANKPRFGQFEEPKWRQIVPVFRQGEGPDSALPYKAYIGGSNYCIEIVRQSSGRWVGEVISRFQANQADYQRFMQERKTFLSESFSGLPLVMRLIADDTIAVEVDGHRKVFRLYKMNNQLTMYFAEATEGNVAARASSGSYKPLTPRADPLRKMRARRVFVDPLGNVRDPGFKE